MMLEGLVIPVSFATGLLAKGVDVITDLIGDAISATTEWAEGMDKLGDVTGMTTDQLASWSFVAQKAGVEVDTLAGATVILQKGLFDAKGELSTTGKALTDFGVDIKDANGNVKDQSVLMGDIAKKYQTFGTQTQRVDFLTNIFGKSGAQLVDVFDVLAQEGGIDKVERKVKDLGLVLDPAAYESFDRNLKEVGLTFTGLANTLVGPMMPAAQSLLDTFTAWLQSPWMIDAIKGVAENLGILASDIATGIQTGNWDAFFTDFEKLTGIDIEPAILELQKFADWITNVGIPKLSEFYNNAKTGMADFKDANKVETNAIKEDWNKFLDTITKRLDIIFGGEGKGKFISWAAIGKTALQVIDLGIKGITKASELLNVAIQTSIDLWNSLVDVSTSTAVYVPPGASSAPGNASGGAAGGMTWVGESGPELVNLPNGSYVNHNQQSNRMSNQPVQAYIDYDELARTLSRVLGQQMQRA